MAEGEWQSSLEAVAKSDARKYKLTTNRQQCLGLSSFPPLSSSVSLHSPSTHLLTCL